MGWLPRGWEGAQGIAGGLKEQVRGSRGGVPVVIPVGIAAGDLGRARGSVAPRRGTSCHAGPAGRRERRGAGLNGAGAGNVWATRLGRTSGALACGGMGRVRRRRRGVGRGKSWAAGSELGLGCFGLVFKFGVLGRFARVWVGLTCLSWVFPNFKPTQT